MTDKVQKAYLLPLREVVVLPGNSASLFVGREKSLKAIEKLTENDATAKEHTIILATQKVADKNDVTFDDLYPIAVLAQLDNPVKMENGTIRVIVTSVSRIRLTSLAEENDYLVAEYKATEDSDLSQDERVPLVRTIHKQLNEYSRHNKDVEQKMIQVLLSIDDLTDLIYQTSSDFRLKPEQRIRILQEENLASRAEYLSKCLEELIEVQNVEGKLRSRIKGQMEKGQREYYLSEQIKAAQRELGVNEESEEGELKDKIEKAGMPPSVKKKALEELRKLNQMMPISAEASVIRSYIGWLIDLPWKKKSKVSRDLDHVNEVLEHDHYGLIDVKKRILEYIAVQNRVSKLSGPILCLVGPPGVGKTSLGESIARATNRQYIRLALGGVRDESEIRGHRRTYVGSMPGRIIQRLAKAGVRNPLFLLDEIDKMGNDWRGDPSSALLEVLDPEQNSTFSDHFLEVEFDLSDVMFVCTANSEAIPPALLDRMELIRIPGYTLEEKKHIARRHLIPKQSKKSGIKAGEINITDPAIDSIISRYTREAGVRGLEREIAKITRKVIIDHDWKDSKSDAKDEPSQAANTQTQYTVQDVASPEQKIGEIKPKVKSGESIAKIIPESLQHYLGVPRYRSDRINLEPQVGQVHGLAWTSVGGEILSVEATTIPGGRGKVISTGSLGDVMKESVQTALTVVRTRSRFVPVIKGFPDKRDIHVHMPDGATRKDGPSAGVALTLALISTITGQKLRGDVAVTGEITLRGEVLKIGGLKEKLLAAHRNRIKEIIIPDDNLQELAEVPKEILAELKINPIRWIDEAFPLAFYKPSKSYLSSLGKGVGVIDEDDFASLNLDVTTSPGSVVKESTVSH